MLSGWSVLVLIVIVSQFMPSFVLSFIHSQFPVFVFPAQPRLLFVPFVCVIINQVFFAISASGSSLHTTLRDYFLRKLSWKWGAVNLIILLWTKKGIQKQVWLYNYRTIIQDSRPSITIVHLPVSCVLVTLFLYYTTSINIINVQSNFEDMDINIVPHCFVKVNYWHLEGCKVPCNDIYCYVNISNWTK